MRSRNIKPGYFQNPDLAECSPLARILFAGLWTIADKEGKMKDIPKKIKALILPYDDVDADKLLDELAERDFIVRYATDGWCYIAIPSWKRHARPHRDEKAEGYPDPPPQRRPRHEPSQANGEHCAEQKPGNFPASASQDSPTVLAVALNDECGMMNDLSPPTPPLGEKSDGLEKSDLPCHNPEHTQDATRIASHYHATVRPAARTYCADAIIAILRDDPLEPGDLVKAVDNYARHCDNSGTKPKYRQCARTFFEKKTYLEYLHDTGPPENSVEQIQAKLARQMLTIHGEHGVANGAAK
jgi:hypothetical protein